MLKIYSRKEWGAARPKDSRTKMTQKATASYAHHTVTSGSRRWKRGERKHMRELQQIAFSRGFDDISYSFVIFRSGRVYKGRGWGIVGAHTEGSNSTSHAFCFVGNFESDRPTEKALQACAALHRRGIARGFIAKSADIRGHRDAPGAATACPGKNLYEKLARINKLSKG